MWLVKRLAPWSHFGGLAQLWRNAGSKSFYTQSWKWPLKGWKTVSDNHFQFQFDQQWPPADGSLVQVCLSFKVQFGHSKPDSVCHHQTVPTCWQGNLTANNLQGLKISFKDWDHFDVPYPEFWGDLENCSVISELEDWYNIWPNCNSFN